jgi:hypothetical protein
MAKTTKKNQHNEVTNTLALSNVHLRVEELENTNKWLLKQIKRKQTEFKNFVEQIRDLASQLFQKSSPKVKELMTLDQEIHQIFEQIFNNRKFGKDTGRKIKEVYEQLQEIGLISPISDEDEDVQNDLDELFENIKEHQETNQFFNSEFNQPQDQQDQENLDPKNNKTESREIRQTFLRLASIFHPDKVRDESSQMQHTEIMQEINRAYQEGDLAALLEIEQKHEIGESIDIDNVDSLTRKCEILEKRNISLEIQYEDLKRELRLVKNTPEGEMVSDYRRAKREKVDAIAEILDDLEQQVSLIKEVRDFVRDFRDKKITVKTFLEGPESFHRTKEDLMEELLEQILDEMEEYGFDPF